jgi:diguanylate cyclase (GGDEF)-like protein
MHGGFVAVLYVDLDRFKHINDSLGHAIGDQLLQTVAKRLLGCVRSTDTVSRQGGDEFVVLLADIHRVEAATLCAEKILTALEAPYAIGVHALAITSSIGVAIFPNDAGDGDALLRCADHAMYQAKYHGRNNFRLYSAHLNVANVRRALQRVPARGDKQISFLAANFSCLHRAITLRSIDQEDLTKENIMGRGILLWMLGVPLPVILLLAMCSHH